MIENNIPPTHPHHTKLYIVLGVLILLVAGFFFFRSRYDVIVIPEIPPAEPEYIVLSDDDIKEVEAAIKATPKPVPFTAEQLKKRAIILKEAGINY